MKEYLVDTNVFLRFLLKDDLKHFKIANKFFTQAKKGKVILILIPEVVFELDYVLRGVYSLSKKETADILANLIKSPTLQVDDREVLIKTVEKYKKLNIELVDIFLYQTVQKEKLQILSFDKDFSKVKNSWFWEKLLL